jgi:FMN phosphatase YigB (HAD superfamily)
MRKPDSRIYTLTCEQAGSKPTAAVFLDDNYDNIEAARALGIEVVHVGLDPLVAIAELQEILGRRGTKVKNR